MSNNPFSANRGIESIINKQPHTPGAMWLTEDGQNLYIDSKNNEKRIKITDIIDINTLSDSEKQQLQYFPNKIYIDGYRLKKYNPNTKTMEIISDLESEILEPDVKFTFDKNNTTVATFPDTSLPKKGTIVVDNTGNVGVVISSTVSTVTVKLISMMGDAKNLSGNDIYFDSNADYDGEEVGTFERPFKTWTTLHTKYADLLKSSVPITIHLKTNAYLEIKNLANVNSATFVGNGQEQIKFTDFVFILTNTTNNIVFKNLNITTNADNQCIYLSSNITFDGCVLNALSAACVENLCVNNSIIVNNLHIDYSNNINVYKTVANSVDYNNSDEIYFYDCKFDDLIGKVADDELDRIRDTRNINITNCEILNTINITNASSVIINGGSFHGSMCTLDAEFVNLGTFNLNGVTPTISNNSNLNVMSGVSSEQVYDKTTTRQYGIPNDYSLKSHLDKIGENIKTLNNTLVQSGNTPEAFMTKMTFTSQTDLNGEFRVGDVLTYVNELDQRFEFIHNLLDKKFEIVTSYDYANMKYYGSVDLYENLPKNPNDGDVYSVTYNNDYSSSGIHYIFNNNKWSVVNPSIEEWWYTFELDNASYIIKPKDTIYLLKYKAYLDENKKYTTSLDIQNVSGPEYHITATVSLIVNNTITIKITPSNLIKQIKTNMLEVIEGDIDTPENNEIVSNFLNNYLKKSLSNVDVTQTIDLYYKDRVIKLSNAWDKLSGSSSGGGVGKQIPGLGEIFNDYNNNEAIGKYSHAEGHQTLANGDYSHVQGRFNVVDKDNKYAHIVGNGDGEDITDDVGNIITAGRSNAHTLDWNGNAWFAGDVTVGPNNKRLLTNDDLTRVIGEGTILNSTRMLTGTYIGTGDSDEKSFVFNSKVAFMYIHQVDFADSDKILASATYIGGTNVLMITNGSDAAGTHNRYLGNVIENETEHTITFTNASDLNRTFKYAWVAILQ